MLRKLVKRKAAGKPIKHRPEQKPSNVIDLMQALQQSLKKKKKTSTGNRKRAS